MGFYNQFRGKISRQSFYNVPLKELNNHKRDGSWATFKSEHPATWLCVWLSLTIIPVMPFLGPSIRLLLGLDNNYEKYPDFRSIFF